MKSMTIVVLALGLIAPLSVAAQETTEAERDQIVDSYVKCTALWKWTSEVMRENGKPAVATYMSDMGNGAKTAASWVLSASHMLSNPEAEPRKLGYWDSYLQPKIDGELSRYRAMAEMGESMEPDLALCTELSEGQAKIIEMIRKQYPENTGK